jgi:excisionase family DNA binding protein
MASPSVTSPWRLFTPDEAAPILRMSRATIYRQLAEGLPHHNIRGVGVRFTAEDIDLILRQSERGRR